MKGVVHSILGADFEQARRALDEAPPGAVLVELRADRLPPDDVERLVRKSGRPLIVTVRRRGDGGSYEGSEDERRRTLRRALRAGAAFVDVEHGSALADLAAGEARGRVILSCHGVPCRAAPLGALYREMAGTGAARVKIVPAAASLSELDAVRRVLREATAGVPLACFASGAAGRASRVLALAWGSWATYGSAGAGRETGDGQIPARDLLEVYDVLALGSATRIYALAGGSVAGSPSPAMHAAGYRRHGLDAVYLSIDATSFGEALALLRPGGEPGLSGLAVTMPFKEAAASASECSDVCSRASRAVNTLRLDGDRLLGFNTDGPAIAEIAARHHDLAGARVAVTGAGGTARAAAASLKAQGATVRLFARSASRAEAAARDLGVGASPLETLAGADWEILVQATPLGSRGEEVLPAGALAGRSFVLDAAYGPAATPLVRAARAAGVAVADGLELLAAQAARQFEIFTGLGADPDLLAAAGRAWLAAASSPRDGGS